MAGADLLVWLQGVEHLHGMLTCTLGPHVLPELPIGSQGLLACSLCACKACTSTTSIHAMHSVCMHLSCTNRLPAIQCLFTNTAMCGCDCYVTSQQAVKPSGSSSSHGSAAGHHHHKQAQPGDVSATAAGVSAALAAAMAAAAAGSVPQLGSPGSSLSLHSSPGGGAVSSTRQAGAVGAGGATSQGGSRQPSSSGGVYQPVLLGPSRASADTGKGLLYHDWNV